MHPSTSLALRVFLLLFLASSFTTAQPQFQSEWDKSFEYACRQGRYLQSINSRHDNHREDRVYNLACNPLPYHFSTRGPAQCNWSGYVNSFNEMVVYQCPGNGYVAGLQSYHSNGHEDRRHKFYCCTLPHSEIKNCFYTGWLNKFDQPVHYHVPYGKVLRGMVSYHDNHYQDRRFNFLVCNLI